MPARGPTTCPFFFFFFLSFCLFYVKERKKIMFCICGAAACERSDDCRLYPKRRGCLLSACREKAKNPPPTPPKTGKKNAKKENDDDEEIRKKKYAYRGHGSQTVWRVREGEIERAEWNRRSCLETVFRSRRSVRKMGAGSGGRANDDAGVSAWAAAAVVVAASGVRDREGEK